MQLGATLKSFRERKRISQEEVAHILKVSQKTYSNIESDKSIPSLVQLAKLSEVLEFDLLDVMKEQGITFNQNNSEFNDNSGSYIVNNYPDKLIEQYEKRLLEKEKIIALLEEKIFSLKQKPNN